MKLHPLLLAGLVVLGGCGTFRGIPSHGGGKRFDEEQRIVSSAIRQSLAEMDLQELRGKRVRVVVDSIAHEGSGNVNWPGLTNLGTAASINWNENNYLNRTANEWRVSDTESTGISGNTSYRANPEYYSSYSGTSQDLLYLRAVLDMKARHAGLVLEGEPQVALFVLVDVLGLNRSRRSYMFKSNDNYHASCEITYYAQDLASGELIFRERQIGAMSAYDEEHTWLSPWIAASYTTVPTCPIVPLLDETDRPILSNGLATSQPAPVDAEPLPPLIAEAPPAGAAVPAPPDAVSPAPTDAAVPAPANAVSPATPADAASPAPIDAAVPATPADAASPAPVDAAVPATPADAASPAPVDAAVPATAPAAQTQPASQPAS